MISHAELLARIAIGSALGGVIGFERDRHHRPVGLRTHSIVAMAAATFMVISSQFIYYQHYGRDDLVEVDSSRIAASVVSGIGFLAGGAILRTGLTVQGLTTAAGLWLVTAIGMCAGAGMFVESAVVTVMGIGALTLLRRFEDKNMVRRRVTVVLGAAGEPTHVISAVKSLGAKVFDIDVEHSHEHEDPRVTLIIDLQIVQTVTATKLASLIEGEPGVRRVRVQPVA